MRCLQKTSCASIHRCVTRRCCRVAAREQGGGRLIRRSLPHCQADPSNKETALDKDSDLVFIGKLVLLSFGGGAAVKYGSLLSPVPFSENAALALALVLGPPALYAVVLLTRGSK